MKTLSLLFILIIYSVGYSQDIKSLNERNSKLMDSLSYLTLELNQCSTRFEMNVLELEKSKSSIIDKIKNIELRKLQIIDNIEKYNVSIANKLVYENIKNHEIYIVRHEYDKKIKKLRKHLIKSEFISSTDSLLFTIDNIYKYSIDNNNLINYLQNLIIDNEISNILQIKERDKTFLIKLHSKNSFLELKTGVNEQYLSLNDKLKLVNDSILFYSIALNNTKHKVDSLLLEIVNIDYSKIKNTTNHFDENIENNSIDIKYENREEIQDFICSDLEYPGGLDKLYSWINKNLEFPDGSDGGLLRVQLNISKRGKVSGIEFLNSSPEELLELKNQIKRVFKNMPTWEPATCNGNPIDEIIIIPINFEL